jgi:hypothetical protein
MNLTAKEKEAIVRKVRKEAKARADRLTGAPDRRFHQREAEYLRAHPHLAKHKHCGICPDTIARPTRRVVMPNGVVLHTSWYKVPTTDADLKRAFKEQQWLCSKEGREYYRVMFA